MIKTLVMTAMLLGCTPRNREGQEIPDPKESCLGGWTYYRFKTYLSEGYTPKLGRLGLPEKCNMDEAK